MSAAAAIRVAVADDHTMVRDGLRRILESSPDIRVVIDVESAEELLTQLARVGADVCVVDLSMPGMGGLQAAEHLRAIAPSVRVIIISFHPPAQYAVRALSAGASAYLTKESTAQELVAAVSAVARGERYITPEVQGLLVREVRDDRPHGALSNRELAVLVGLAEGQSLADIARAVGLSAKTVSTYRARMMRKLDLTTNADVVQYAIAHKLVSITLP